MGVVTRRQPRRRKRLASVVVRVPTSTTPLLRPGRCAPLSGASCGGGKPGSSRAVRGGTGAGVTGRGAGRGPRTPKGPERADGGGGPGVEWSGRRSEPAGPEPCSWALPGGFPGSLSEALGWPTGCAMYGPAGVGRGPWGATGPKQPGSVEGRPGCEARGGPPRGRGVGVAACVAGAGVRTASCWVAGVGPVVRRGVAEPHRGGAVSGVVIKAE